MSEEKIDDKIGKGYILYTLLAGILTLVPILRVYFKIIDTHSNYVNTSISVILILFYGLKIIGFLIYIFILNHSTKKRNILITVSGASLVLAQLMQSNVCVYIYYIPTFALFIYYAKKFLFKKKVLIVIVTLVILIILGTITGFMIEKITHYMSIQKITEDIPTANDFENELMQRSLFDKNGLLFGVDNKDENIHRINNNSNRKYPSYIYLGYKTKNLTKNFNKDDDYLYWIIYYTNGKIYAALVDYYKLDDSEGFKIYSNILSEEEKQYVYNAKENYYEIIKKDNDYVITKLLYYKDNNKDIAYLEKVKFKDPLREEYEVMDKIDASNLDNYAGQLKTKEKYRRMNERVRSVDD